jgi:peptidoglycan hydrolase-like protein with peptidoglycan-binding domain
MLGRARTRHHLHGDRARERQRLAAGDKLFAVDNRPSVVMIGDEAAFRDLSDGVADGADVAQLEQNLAGLGDTADGQVVIDEHVDAATTAAVEAWQTALGIEASGTVLSSDVVFLPRRPRWSPPRPRSAT